MGKLAERLSDGRRSGVSRVESTEALEEAVMLNGFSLTRIALDGIPDGTLSGIPADAASARADGRVLLFSGFETLVRADSGALDDLLARLRTVAAEQQEAGLRFFAVFLDPQAILPLAQLYNWHLSTAARTP